MSQIKVVDSDGITVHEYSSCITALQYVMTQHYLSNSCEMYIYNVENQEWLNWVGPTPKNPPGS